MRTGRSAIIAAILSLFIILMPSCSKGPEEGAIEELDLQGSEATEQNEESIFTRIDSPFDYEYMAFPVRKAGMQLDIPSEWTTDVISSRFISIRTPDNDGYLPGSTLAILFNYGEDVDSSNNSLTELASHAYTFSDFFKNELAGIPCYADGKRCHLRNYVAEDEIINGLEFVDDEHMEDAAILVSNKVVLVDKANNYYVDRFSMVCGYIKWEHSPVCISAIVPGEYLDNAKQVMRYLISSIRSCSSYSEGFRTASYGDFSTMIPASFIPVEDAENIFYSPLTQNSYTSGMSVGVFKIDGSRGRSMDADAIAESYGGLIAKLAFSPYEESVTYRVQAYDNPEGDSPAFKGNISVDPSPGRDPAEITASVFGSDSKYLADFYNIEKGDSFFLISVIYQKCQKEIASEAGKTAVSSLKVE